MDINERFNQLENLLVDLARKQDQQAGQIAQIIEELNRQSKVVDELREAVISQTEVITSQSEVIISQNEAIAELRKVFGEAITGLGKDFARQEVRLDNLSEQIDDIIKILKLSAERSTEVERRQDAMMAEIQQQSKRQDVAVDALKVLLKRQQTTDSRLDDLVQTELQMLQLMRRDAEKLEDHEPRLKRLEDEFLRPAG